MARTASSRGPTYSSGRSGRRRIRPRSAKAVGPAPARRHGPAPILIIAAIIVALVFCWVFGRGCSGSQQAKENEKLQTYTTSVNKLIQRSAAVASQFNTLKGTIKGMPRDDVNKKLSQMESDCKSIANESGKVVVPSKAGGLQPLLQLSFDLRARGVSEFKTGMLNALDNKDKNAAVELISKGLTDLVVSDQVFKSYQDQLGAKLKAAKLSFVKVADAGQFVPKVDDASVAAIGAYVSPGSTTTSTTTTGTTTTTATNTPAQVMQAYLRNQGIDVTGASFAVVSGSQSDSNWKLDSVTTGSKTRYFILHNVNGSWTVVDYGTGFTTAQLKSDGAPSDMSPTGQ